MLDFGYFILNMFGKLWSLYERIVFDYNGQDVTFGSVILVFLIISITISVFWKGARA